MKTSFKLLVNFLVVIFSFIINGAALLISILVVLVDAKAIVRRRQAPWKPAPSRTSQLEQQPRIVYANRQTGVGQQPSRPFQPSFQAQFPNKNNNRPVQIQNKKVLARPGPLPVVPRPRPNNRFPQQPPPAVVSSALPQSLPTLAPVQPYQPNRATGPSSGNSEQINLEYERIWNQMSQLWEQMVQRIETSGLENDWGNFWTKFTTTIEPYFQQFSQQISEVLGLAVRYQQQQQVEQSQMQEQFVKQVQDGINEFFTGDQNVQQKVQEVVENLFGDRPGKLSKKKSNQSKRSTANSAD